MRERRKGNGVGTMENKQSKKNRIAMGYPYRSRGGQIITDELCLCGGMRSEHENHFAIGYGPMPSRHCKKFTWTDWVTE
jgi:hypothetical protein